MKKVLALLLVMCMFLMSGCMLLEEKVVINADGSGTISMIGGITEEGMREMAVLSGTSEAGIESEIQKKTAQAETFVRNGVTYYSLDNETQDFANLLGLNRFFASSGDKGMENIYFSRKADGALKIQFMLPRSLQEIAAEFAKNMGDETKTGDIQAVFEQSIMLYEFTFPAAIVSVSDEGEGITVNGNKLSLDYVTLMKRVNTEGPLVLTFVTEPGIMIPAKSVFSDVTDDKWYYEAVVEMAEEGMIDGMGDGTFGPESTMTYAQLCHFLLKNSKGMVGEENGYWAGKAIRYCVENGIILSRGEITPANYDVPVSREAAVSAWFLMATGSDGKTDYHAESDFVIPDDTEIDQVYKNNIYGAYLVGISSGVDENGTFMPKKTMTRAEFCQMFYNVVWEH